MKILVGISGGVDSAYAAKKLMLEGHEVEGAVLIMHQHTELAAAREAAESVGWVVENEEKLVHRVGVQSLVLVCPGEVCCVYGEGG